MNNDIIKKLVQHTRYFVEFQKVLKEFLVEYLALIEENKNLIEINKALLEDIKQYEAVLAENKIDNITLM